MTTTRTNDELNAIVEQFWHDLIEGRPVTLDFDNYSTLEITLLTAKIAAKFASYAGDAIDF